MSDRWPNLFIPGVEKGGTTSFWQHLDLRQRLEALFEAERPTLESLLGRRLPW